MLILYVVRDQRIEISCDTADNPYPIGVLYTANMFMSHLVRYPTIPHCMRICSHNHHYERGCHGKLVVQYFVIDPSSVHNLPTLPPTYTISNLTLPKALRKLHTADILYSEKCFSLSGQMICWFPWLSRRGLSYLYTGHTSGDKVTLSDPISSTQLNLLIVTRPYIYTCRCKSSCHGNFSCNCMQYL